MEDHTPKFLVNDSCLDISELKAPNYDQYQIEFLLQLHEKGRYPTLIMLDEVVKHHTKWTNLLNQIKEINVKLMELSGSNTISIRENLFRFLYVNKFDEKFADYLKPLVHPDSVWNEQLLDIFLRMCDHLEKNRNPFDPVNERVVVSWFEKSVLHDNWVKSFCDEWSQRDIKHIDLQQIKELMVNICRYNVSDYSVAIYYLVTTRNNLVARANDCWLLLRNCWMNNDIYFEDLLERVGYKGLFELYPSFDFRILFENWKIEMLTTMHRVLKYNDIQTLISDDYQDKLDDWSYKPSFGQPEIEKYVSHRARYGLSQLRIIYKNGWEYWVKQLLGVRGVGIRKLSFACGVSLKLESVCTYWFDQSFAQSFAHINRSDLKSLCQMAKDNEFYELLDKILEKFGNLLTSRDYFEGIREKSNRESYSARRIYLKHWEKYFYDDIYINCEDINKAKLVRELWHHLPKKESKSGEEDNLKVPLMKHIKKMLISMPVYTLVKKDMHFINVNWEKVHAYPFDDDMNEFGKFKQICMKVCKGSVERAVKKMKCVKHETQSF